MFDKPCIHIFTNLKTIFVSFINYKFTCISIDSTLISNFKFKFTLMITKLTKKLKKTNKNLD